MQVETRALQSVLTWFGVHPLFLDRTPAVIEHFSRIRPAFMFSVDLANNLGSLPGKQPPFIQGVIGFNFDCAFAFENSVVADFAGSGLKNTNNKTKITKILIMLLIFFFFLSFHLQSQIPMDMDLAFRQKMMLSGRLNG